MCLRFDVSARARARVCVSACLRVCVSAFCVYPASKLASAASQRGSCVELRLRSEVCAPFASPAS
eukprot:11035759-Lingulodinium_polyedra.AAC.1